MKSVKPQRVHHTLDDRTMDNAMRTVRGLSDSIGALARAHCDHPYWENAGASYYRSLDGSFGSFTTSMSTEPTYDTFEVCTSCGVRRDHEAGEQR